MDIGKAIKMLRQERNMTQVQLAERCLMNNNSLSDLETGKTFPPKSTIERICKAIGIPVAYVLMASIEECDFPESKRILYRTQLEPLRKELFSDHVS